MHFISGCEEESNADRCKWRRHIVQVSTRYGCCSHPHALIYRMQYIRYIVYSIQYSRRIIRNGVLIAKVLFVGQAKGFPSQLKAEGGKQKGFNYSSSSTQIFTTRKNPQ